MLRRIARCQLEGQLEGLSVNYTAYLDAGSVSMVVSAIAAGAAGVAVFFKTYARKLTGRSKSKPDTPEE